MRDSKLRERLRENVTKTGNTAPYTGPTAYSSKSIPVLVDGFIRRYRKEKQDHLEYDEEEDE